MARRDAGVGYKLLGIAARYQGVRQDGDRFSWQDRHEEAQRLVKEKEEK